MIIDSAKNLEVMDSHRDVRTLGEVGNAMISGCNPQHALNF